MTHLDLSADVGKKIYIDPTRLRKGEHAWTISTDDGRVVAAALQVGIWSGVYSKHPLFNNGPNCWLETTDEWEAPEGAELVVWPVPITGPASTDIDLSDGVMKRVHVDRNLLRRNAAAWTVRTAEGLVISEGLVLGEGIVGVQSRRALFPGGPHAWLEVTAEVVVDAGDRIHQAVFPKALSPTEVPHHGRQS